MCIRIPDGGESVLAGNQGSVRCIREIELLSLLLSSPDTHDSLVGAPGRSGRVWGLV